MSEPCLAQPSGLFQALDDLHFPPELEVCSAPLEEQNEVVLLFVDQACVMARHSHFHLTAAMVSRAGSTAK